MSKRLNVSIHLFWAHYHAFSFKLERERGREFHSLLFTQNLFFVLWNNLVLSMLQFHRVGNFFSIISDTLNILVSSYSINEQLKDFQNWISCHSFFTLFRFLSLGFHSFQVPIWNHEGNINSLIKNLPTDDRIYQYK